MMKKTFAFALLLTLCSGSNAFGMETFHKALDTVNKYVADSVLNAQELPVIRHIFHEGRDDNDNHKSVLGKNARYSKSLLSCVLLYFGFKNETIRNGVSKVVEPVKNLVHGKKA